MLIHQGRFTALYTQNLLNSQSFEFEICIIQALNMPLICCTNIIIFPREAITSHYFPLREDSPPSLGSLPSLGLGTTWVMQLRSGSCHHPTAATKCNNSRAEPSHSKPHRWKSMLIHQGWFSCAIYSTLTRFTKF